MSGYTHNRTSKRRACEFMTKTIFLEFPKNRVSLAFLWFSENFNFIFLIAQVLQDRCTHYSRSALFFLFFSCFGIDKNPKKYVWLIFIVNWFIYVDNLILKAHISIVFVDVLFVGPIVCWFV